MKGTHVCKLRKQFGWSGQEMADLLGVHYSTLYRWEQAGEDAIKVSPLQERLLTVLARFWRGATPQQRKDLKEHVQEARAGEGQLGALYVFLRTVYADE